MYDYETLREKMYPGYKVKGYKEKHAELTRLEEKKKNWISRYNREKQNGQVSEEAMDGVNESCKEYEAYKEALLSGDAFIDQSIKDFDYIPTEIEFSLGDINGRGIVDSHNRISAPVDHYNNTECAEIIREGESATAKPLTDSLEMMKTDSDDAIIFDDIRGIGYGTYEDDKNNLSRAFEHTHKIHFVNAENKKAFELMIGSKAPISISVDKVQSVINSNLCGKAKRKAVIVVNKSGFSALDIDINGMPLVTKDSNGNFIYKNKYKIQEVPEEILPNTETGSPIIIGDMSIVKFFVLREDYLEKDDFFTHNMMDRGIRKEIITLATISNEAYIHGVLE